MRTGLGLDTGGTYTDAVIMDVDSGQVLCKAKSPTTRENLCIGIRGAIGRMDPGLLSDVGVVSLSSTLATNSVVEGKGARVALVCIGGEYDNSCPADFRVNISGGHDLHGMEAAPLDEDSARTFLESVRGRVDGVAVAGYLAVRNPDHENRIRDLARDVLGIPVVCGHDLSSGLGFNERAATCVINARLIPIIDELIRSVKAVMSDFGIKAPLMIVRGDGSMMSEADAKEKPVETVLSGPAASLIGAMRMTGLKDAIVMDMGGTTTDIGILRNGKPRLDPEGATIGGIRTRVMAAEISTSGIGGDSRILVIGGDVALTPLRVMPLCFAAERWPSVAESLRNLPENGPRTYAMQDENTVVLDSEFFRLLRKPTDDSDFSSNDMKLLDTLTDVPMTLREVSEITELHPFTFNIRRLEGLGLIQRVGFTPTDVLHAGRSYVEFDADASRMAATYLAKGMRADSETFLVRCRERIRSKLCTELMKELVSEELGSPVLGAVGENLISKAVSGSPGRDYGCSISLTKPIIGIGAPVRSYIPWVGEAFNTDVVITENSDVGNAIGAISSSMSETISILIRPETLGSDGRYNVFSKLGRSEFEDLDEAVSVSEEAGRRFVEDVLRSSGAEDIVVTTDRRDSRFSFGDSGEQCLMEVELTITAAGRPSQFSSE